MGPKSSQLFIENWEVGELCNNEIKQVRLTCNRCQPNGNLTYTLCRLAKTTVTLAKLYMYVTNKCNSEKARYSP